jgi:hypothetical protein
LSSLRGGKGCHAEARGHAVKIIAKNKKMNISNTMVGRQEGKCLFLIFRSKAYGVYAESNGGTLEKYG